MATYDIPMVPVEVAKAIEAYWDGEDGFGPKVPYPNFKPRHVCVAAASIGEAAELAQKSNPGWLPHQSNIMKVRNA